MKTAAAHFPRGSVTALKQLYREEKTNIFTFTFNNLNDILNTINNKVESKLKNAYSRQFYYFKYGTKDLSSLTATWNSTTTDINSNTGYFKTAGALVIGDVATSNLKYAKVGALIKFTSASYEFLNGKALVPKHPAPSTRNTALCMITV